MQQKQHLRSILPTTSTPLNVVRRQFLQHSCALLAIPSICTALPKVGYIPSKSTPVLAKTVVVRVWPSKTYTRITIETDVPIGFSFLMLSSPPRLAVDMLGLTALQLQNTQLLQKLQNNSSPTATLVDPYISDARIAQYTTSTVRLVLDLKQAIQPQIFTLPPFGNYKHRLVLDVYPVEIKSKQPMAIANVLANDETDPLAKAIQDIQNTNINTNTKKTKDVPNTTATAELEKSHQEKSIQQRAIGEKMPLLITIDAGHGGEDTGAIGGAGTQEKDITLKLAYKLRDLINTSPPTGLNNRSMYAYLTRDGDFFVPLQQRVHHSQRMQADVFISIHADAFTTPQASGGSVFALSQKRASSTGAKWLATQENNADALGGVHFSVLKNADAQLKKTVWDMSTQAQISDSLRLGALVLKEMGGVGKLHKGHVEQASFSVLTSPNTPSILVETAFLSNPSEEVKLNNDAHQNQLASAIHNGLRAYFAQRPAVAQNTSKPPQSQGNTDHAKQRR